MQKNAYDNVNLWNKIWSDGSFSLRRHKDFIMREERSIRWKKIIDAVLASKVSFDNLRVVELGAGRGTMSLLMALRGAQVTLVDSSDTALEQARIIFNEFNCKADFKKADIFNLTAESANFFDISMSFGLGEHFQGTLRQKIFDIHFEVLRENGITFISVPNRLCLPYRTWKKLLELNHEWIYGIEVPFTRSELKRIASLSGFRSEKIIGSGFLNAIDQFLLYGKLTRLGINTEIPSLFDDYFGYALVLIAHKQIHKGF